MEASKDLSFEEIAIGDTASFVRTWTTADVEAFAQLSGDRNPLHMDASYAAGTRFGRRVVHGLLVGSMCSALVGMYLPGKRCLYLKQSLSFKKPVFIDDELMIRGTVSAKSIATRVLNVSISITRDSEEVIEGEAIVQVLES